MLYCSLAMIYTSERRKRLCTSSEMQRTHLKIDRRLGVNHSESDAGESSEI